MLLGLLEFFSDIFCALSLVDLTLVIWTLLFCGDGVLALLDDGVVFLIICLYSLKVLSTTNCFGSFALLA